MVWAHAIPKPSSGRWLKELPAIDLRRSGAVLGGSTAGCAPWMPRLRRRLRRRQPPSEQTGSVGAPPGRLHPCTPLRRPDPAPATFGYHEVFHLLVIAGVAAHFLAIGRYALPTG
jgi:predicted membrane channel-forming protein YqfA (hemolysin III family)